LKIDSSRVLAYSCPHIPYHHSNAFKFLAELKREYKPTTVVCLGDLCDLHQFSKWPKNPECLGPAEEIRQAREGIRELASIFPRQLVCWSNHDKRLERFSIQHGIPLDCTKKWEEVFKPPRGWLFAWKWEVGPALAIHGDRYSGKDGIRNAVRDNFCSTLMGHIHTEQGVFHQDIEGGMVWGAQVGCLIDPKYAAFEYEQKNRNRPVHGAVVVIKDQPWNIKLV
jgi:hypothetical protein